MTVRKYLVTSRRIHRRIASNWCSTIRVNLIFRDKFVSITFAPMFKRGIAVVLIVCTLMANFVMLFVFAGFQLNQKYIATTLCVNRDKPWLHCNGRCYLMKKIKAAEDKEKSTEQQNQKNLLQQAFCSSVKKVVFSSQLLQVFPENYNAISPQNVPLGLLRPPRFA